MNTPNVKWYLTFETVLTEDAFRNYSLPHTAKSLRMTCGVLVVLLMLAMAFFFDNIFVVVQCAVLIAVSLLTVASTFVIKSHVHADIVRMTFVSVWSVVLLLGYHGRARSEVPSALLRGIALQFVVMLASDLPTRLFLPFIAVFAATQSTLLIFMVQMSHNVPLFVSQFLFTLTLLLSGMWALYHKELAARSHFLMLRELHVRQTRISSLQEHMKTLSTDDILSDHSTQFEVGAHTDIGERPSNEDRHSIYQAEDHSFFAVYDGHSGDLASQYCADHLYQVIKSSPAFKHGDIDTALINGHRAIEEKVLDLCSQLSAADGTTTVCALIFGEVLYVANVGDSEAILCRGNGRIQVLSRLHQPVNPDEALRVVQEGGRLYRQRIGHPIINPAVASIAVSRSIGDLAYKRLKDGLHSGLSATPHVEATTLTGRDMFLLLASDGVFEAMDHTDCVRYIEKSFKEGKSAAAAAEALCRECMDRGSCDNVTAVIVLFNVPSDTRRGDTYESLHDESLMSMRTLEVEANDDLRAGCLGISFGSEYAHHERNYINWILSQLSLSNELTWTFLIMTRVGCALMIVLTHDSVLPLMMLVGTPAALLSYAVSTLVSFHKYAIHYHTTTFLLMQSIAICLFWRDQDIVFLCLLGFTTIHINLFAIPSVAPAALSSIFQFLFCVALTALGMISPEALVYMFLLLGTSLWFSWSVALCRRREYLLRMGCEGTLAEEKTLANCLVKAQQRGLISERALLQTSDISLPMTSEISLSSQSQSSFMEYELASPRVGAPLMGESGGDNRVFIPTVYRPLFGPMIAQFASLFLVFKAPRLESQFKSYHLMATRKYGRILAALTFLAQIGLLAVELRKVNGLESHQRSTARTAYIAIRCATMGACACVMLLLRGSAPIDFDRFVLAGAYIVFILMDVLLSIVDSFVFAPPVGITLVFTLKVVVLHFYAPSIFFVDLVKLDVLGFCCSIIRHVYPYHIMGKTSVGIWLSAASPMVFIVGLLGAAVLESRQRRLFVLLTKAQKYGELNCGTLEKMASTITSKVDRTPLGYFSPVETETAFRKYYVSDTLRFLRLVLLVLSVGLSALGVQDTILFRNDTPSMRIVLTMRLSAIAVLTMTGLVTYTRVFPHYSQIIMGSAGLLCALLGFASYIVAVESSTSAQIFQEAVLNHHSSACLMLFLVVNLMNFHLITAAAVSVIVVLCMVVAHAVIGFAATFPNWLYFSMTVALGIPPTAYHEHRQRSHFLIWLHLKHVLGVLEDYGEGEREIVEEHLISTRRMLSAGDPTSATPVLLSKGFTHNPNILARAVTTRPSFPSGPPLGGTVGVPGVMNISGTRTEHPPLPAIDSDEEETYSVDEYVLPWGQTMVSKTPQREMRNIYRQSCPSDGSRQHSEGSHRRQQSDGSDIYPFGRSLPSLDRPPSRDDSRGEMEESLQSYVGSLANRGKEAGFMNKSFDLGSKKHARLDQMDIVSKRKQLVRYHSSPALALNQGIYSTLSSYPSRSSTTISAGAPDRSAATRHILEDAASVPCSPTSPGASSHSHLPPPSISNSSQSPSLPHIGGAKPNPPLAPVTPVVPSLPIANAVVATGPSSPASPVLNPAHGSGCASIN